MADFDFNQDTMEAFKNFQKLKRKKALQRVGNVTHNLAEGAQAALRGRAPSFQGMPDESDTYLTPMQKAEKSAPILKQMEEREQFYFSEALKDAQKKFAEQQTNARALLTAASAHERTTQQAAQAGARNKLNVLSGQLGKVHSDQGRLMEPTEDTNAAVKALVENAEATAKLEADAHLVAILGSPVARKEMSALSEEEQEVYVESKRVEAQESAQKDMKVDVLKNADVLFKDMEPGQAAMALTMLQENTGITDQELVNSPIGAQAQQVFQQAQQEMQRLGQEASVLESDMARAAASTWGDSSQVQERSAALAAGAQFGGQSGPQEVAGGATVSEVQEQAQAQEGEAGPPQDPNQSRFGEHYFNDPSLPKVSGDANQRMEDILDLIEAQPEHPPLQEARNQLMASPDFQKFQKARGYEDPDVAFREMRRELRLKKKEQRRVSEAKVAENVDAGRAPSSIKSRVRKLAQPASTPVQGSVSRTPAEVETDGNLRR